MFEAEIDSLIDVVQASRTGRQDHHLIVISFDQIASSDLFGKILLAFHRRMAELSRWVGGETVQIADATFAIPVQLTDYKIMGVVPELRLNLLRLIRAHLPQGFGTIDQMKLVRLFHMARERAEILRLLEACRSRKPSGPAPRGGRALAEEDVLRTVDLLRRGGLQHFAGHHLQFQPISLVLRGHPPSVALRELFVGMDRLKREILSDINLMASQHMFRLLTVELDQLVLEAIGRGLVDTRFGCVNLNVETVFTRTFEEVAQGGRLKNLVFEFQVADMLANFDKFLLVRQAVAEIGCRIALDGVRPAMLKVLRPAGTGAAVVKVLCDVAGEASALGPSIREMAAAGIHVVFARVESEAAMQAGVDMGVSLFQGLYIDRLMTRSEERERYMVG